MARQGRFAVVAQAGWQCILGRRGGGLQFDVRHDAGGLDRLAAGRVIARGGQLHRITVVQRQHGLHRALAEGTAADHARTLVVAQRAGQDFRCTGRTGIGQHDHRCALQQVARGRVESCIADADAATGADDVALVEQIIGHLHGSGQQATRVAAQVQHQALELATGLLLQLLHVLLEVRTGIGLEGAQADVAIAGFQQAAAHAGHADGLAGEAHVERLGLAFAHDGQHHLAAGRAAQRLAGIDRTDRLAVDGDDQVTSEDAGLGRRGVVDRRDHLHAGVVRLLLQLHADALVGTIGLLVEGLRVFLVEVGAVRIEVEQQATHGRLHQLLVIDRIDICGAHRVVHGHETADVLQRHLRGHRLLAVRCLPAGFLARGGRGLLRPGQRWQQGQQEGGGTGCAHGSLLSTLASCPRHMHRLCAKHS